MPRVIAGRYELIELLGRGGMGAVWRARDRTLGRDVAVKEVTPPPGLEEDQRARLYARTIREARSAARLDHPGIVTVHDVVEEDGRPWIVMRLVRAPSLDRVLAEQGRLPAPRVAAIGARLVEALSTAHAAGVVHRDVKPGNVLLDGDRAVLTDFGLCFPAGSASLTKSGHFMGSPAYVAPEVAAGEQATPRSDLWSLGATLFAALEGRPPFERDNVLATLSALANEPAPVPRNAGPLAPVVSGLLAKNPARRLSHARAADRLERALAGPRSGRRPPTPRLRMMAAIALAGATVASCGIGVTALVIGMSRQSSGPSATEPATAATQARAGAADDAPPGTASAALVVRARTDNCRIFVSVPGPSMEVLSDETLSRGDARQYDRPRLNAVIHDASACDVWVNGQRKPLGESGRRQTYTVTKETSGS